MTRVLLTALIAASILAGNAEARGKKTQDKEPVTCPLEAGIDVLKKTYPLPENSKASPAVDVEIIMTNKGDRNVEFYTLSGDATEVQIKMTGPGVGVIDTPQLRRFTCEYRASKLIKLAPGESHRFPLKNLSNGDRRMNKLTWTKPGTYKIDAIFKTQWAFEPKKRKTVKVQAHGPDGVKDEVIIIKDLHGPRNISFTLPQIELTVGD